MIDELTELEMAVLTSICSATNGSKSAHVPAQHFMRKFNNQMKMAKRALHNLVSLGYVTKHPTSGEMTYELTNNGFLACKKIKDELMDLK